MKTLRSFAKFLIVSALLIVSSWQNIAAQNIEFERARGKEMLAQLKRDFTKTYYDPTFGGKNVDAIFGAAEEKISRADSIGFILGIMATTLMSFDDSHTYFVPPRPADNVQHGWELQMLGDRCFVTAVKPGSDAEAKNLKPGDEIVVIGGYTPTRRNLSNLLFFLTNAPSMHVVVKKLSGAIETLDIAAKVRPGKRVLDLSSSNPGADIGTLIRQDENDAVLHTHRYFDRDDSVMIWKMPEFGSERVIDDLMLKAVKHKALILDLRGNGGGYESALTRLVGWCFDRDIKIGDLKGRKETKPLTAKTRGKNAFTGKLIVLIDANSGSSSELFARVVQLEKRGTIIGDRSAGVVMQGTYTPHRSGTDLVFYYGASITSADIIMADGKSLERVGVVPDEILTPTPEDLAAGRDPVLTRALATLDLKIDPEKAGAMFPVQWRP